MIGKYTLRFASLGYLAVILVAPVGYVFWKTFEHGLAPAWDAVTTPDAVHALKVTLILTAIAVPANTLFGVLAALAIVRHRFPAAGAFARGCRPRSAPAVRAWRLARRSRDRLRPARHGSRDDLRLAAVRRSRGRAGVAGERHRAGAGGRDARGVVAADVQPSDLAGDSLGDGLRRRADDRARARRVRRSERHFRPPHRPDRVHDSLCPGPLSVLRRGRRLRDVRRPCLTGGRHAHPDDSAEAQGGDAVI